MDRTSFRWTSGYRGETEYEIYDRTGCYRARLLHTLTAYDDKHCPYNGTRADYERDVVGAHNLLHRAYSSDKEIPADTLAAFNQWRAQEHFRHLEDIRSQPTRYGEVKDGDPILTPPPAVNAGRYEIGKGWIVTATP